MDIDIPAFQGKGWLPRTGDSRLDVIGRVWSAFGVSDQYSPLRKVALCLPQQHWLAPFDWRMIQYIRPVHFSCLRKEIEAYVGNLVSAGVEVEVLDLPSHLPNGRVPYNAIFARDLFCMTPEGAIAARMSSVVRAGEELITQQLLTNLRIPLILSVHGSAVFEGADLIWVNRHHAVLGVGQRTTVAAATQIGSLLHTLDVTIQMVRIPQGVQHLLGIVQVVSPDLAIVRSSRAPSDLAIWLERLGHRVVNIPDSQEVVENQALNFVVLHPLTIIMHAGNPETRRILQRQGITVAAEVTMPNLISAGGGIACATGILHREDPRSAVV